MADPFVEVIARMDPATVVVTAAGDGAFDGCLVGFHCQASIEPLRYAVWLSVKNRTFRLASAADSTHLAVHVLGASDHDLAERFGGETGDEVDKLAGLEWRPGPGGVPLVGRLSTRLVGRIVEQADLAGGDHVAFVLEPVEVEPGDAGAAPLRLSAAEDIEAGHSA